MAIAKHGLVVECSDVVAAFLESLVQEEIWVEQPHRFTNGQQGHACRLNKALYGFIQASEMFGQNGRRGQAGFKYCNLAYVQHVLNGLLRTSNMSCSSSSVTEYVRSAVEFDESCECSKACGPSHMQSRTRRSLWLTVARLTVYTGDFSIL